jgi:hypothetical protein
MTTEELEYIGKQLVDADKRIRFDLEREYIFRLGRLVELNKLKTEKQMSKFFTGRPFVYKFSEQYWWGFTHRLDEKYKIIVSYVELKRMYTQKGQIYFFPRNNEFDGVAFTSHFMDRYMQRLKIKNRDVAIRHFLKKKLEMDVTGWKSSPVPGSKRRFEVITDVGDGVGLGFQMDRIVAFKTFITKEQMKGRQIHDIRNLHEYIEMMETETKYEDLLPLKKLRR